MSSRHMRSERSPRYRWWLSALRWVVCFLNHADRQALSSVLSLLAKDKGFDAFPSGLIGSAFARIYAAGAPIAGVLADTFSRLTLCYEDLMGHVHAIHERIDDPVTIERSRGRGP